MVATSKPTKSRTITCDVRNPGNTAWVSTDRDFAEFWPESGSMNYDKNVEHMMKVLRYGGVIVCTDGTDGELYRLTVEINEHG